MDRYTDTKRGMFELHSAYEKLEAECNAARDKRDEWATKCHKLEAELNTALYHGSKQVDKILKLQAERDKYRAGLMQMRLVENKTVRNHVEELLKDES